MTAAPTKARPITAVQQGTNAELVATAHALYPMGERVLDLTPGDELGFWSRVVPLGLHLLPPGRDFRRTGGRGGCWSDVVFDPPYVAKGGHSTSTIGAMNKRYGMLHVERNPDLQWRRQMVPGCVEAHRLLEPGGRLWFKLQDYVTGGRVHWFTKLALPALTDVGFTLVDEFILDGRPGPQPTRNPDGTPRRQVHARRAHSVLLIARKAR